MILYGDKGKVGMDSYVCQSRGMVRLRHNCWDKEQVYMDKMRHDRYNLSFEVIHCNHYGDNRLGKIDTPVNDLEDFYQTINEIISEQPSFTTIITSKYMILTANYNIFTFLNMSILSG